MKTCDLTEYYKGSVPWIKDRTILLARAGSYSYGTNVPGSDFDYRGVCIPPKEYYFGFSKQFELTETKEPDLVIYELKKFMKLAAGANPNILEQLFVLDEDIIFSSPLGDLLRKNARLFLSKKCFYTYAGYAKGEMHRMMSKNQDGYDKKNAMHLVRLLKMCREILTTGEVVVRRPDAEELLEIRNGSWSYSKLVAWADEQEKELKNLYNNCSILPETPDMDKLNELCSEILQQGLQ